MQWISQKLETKTPKYMGTITLVLVFLVAFATNLQGIHGVEFTISNQAGNTPGGSRFDNEIGEPYAKQAMAAATNFIWYQFEQNTDPSKRKNVPQVTLFLDDMQGVAFTSGSNIHFSANYLEGIKGDLLSEFDGVLYHEMTHVWQWGIGQHVPSGLIEGIADFVRLRAGYVPTHWVRPGAGDRWDQGYDVTAWFLDYCDKVKIGFVAELNEKMKVGYSDSLFVELIGKSVDQLWSDYKIQSGN